MGVGGDLLLSLSLSSTSWGKKEREEMIMKPRHEQAIERLTFEQGHEMGGVPVPDQAAIISTEKADDHDAERLRRLVDRHSDKPLSYWAALARMGFEDDLERLAPERTGGVGAGTLEEMVKEARAVGGILQIRVIKEEGEVVRVVDYETARQIDEK